MKYENEEISLGLKKQNHSLTFSCNKMKKKISITSSWIVLNHAMNLMKDIEKSKVTYLLRYNFGACLFP